MYQNFIPHTQWALLLIYLFTGVTLETLEEDTPTVLLWSGAFLAPGLQRLRSFSCLYCNAEGLRQGLAGLALFGSRQRALSAKQPQDTLS